MKTTGRQSSSRTLLASGPTVRLDQLIRLHHLAGLINPLHNKRSRSAQAGDHRSLQRGRGMDFDEVRVYQPGDDVRSIDWRVTARTARAHTKIFRIEQDRPVIIAVDQRTPMAFGSQVTYKSVMAAQLGTLLAWFGFQQNDKVGGMVFNEQDHCNIKPLRNKFPVLALLNAMVDYNQRSLTPPTGQHSPVDFRFVLENLQRSARPGSAVFLISDFHDYVVNGDTTCERLLHLLKRHTDIYAILVADPLEHELPDYGLLDVTDGTNKLRFDAGDRHLASHYRQQFEQRQQYLSASLQKLGIPLQVVMTTDDPLLAIQRVFRAK